MEKIIKVIPLENGRLQIFTEKGLAGIFDVKPYMQSDFFSELKDENYFKSVKSIGCGVAWPNEQDFSSDTILFDMQAYHK